jgi:hypothetical protein
MLEKHIEHYFVKWCKDQGVLSLKLALLSGGGFPDRTCIANGRVIFIELKTRTGVVSPLQLHWHKKLSDAGLKVFVARSAEEAINLVEDHLL